MYAINVVMRKDVGLRTAHANLGDILKVLRANLAEECVPGWRTSANVSETDGTVTLRIFFNTQVDAQQRAELNDQVIELLSPRAIKHTISVSCAQWEPSA